MSYIVSNLQGCNFLRILFYIVNLLMLNQTEPHVTYFNEKPLKIFSSGSCRILSTISDGHDKVVPIHSVIFNKLSINYLGKFYNVKQHIQLVKYITDKIILPPNIKDNFIALSYGYDVNDLLKIPTKCNKTIVQSHFDTCDWYIFEICSLKIHMKDGYTIRQFYTVQNKDDTTKDYILQTEDDLYNDLCILRNLIPHPKKILVQTHFRRNIIYNDKTQIINNREKIYNVVKHFCDENENIFMYDPSILLRSNHALFDGDVHFTENGHIQSFNTIFNTFFANN